nr:ABC transporter permease [Chloroflexia bacterium]
DLRYALRCLLRWKIFTVSTFITLVIALGVVCVLTSALVRTQWPRSLAGTRQLRYVYALDQQTSLASLYSYPEYLQVRDDSSDAIQLAGFGAIDLTLGLSNRAVRGRTAVITGDYFTVVGGRALLGRLLTTTDDAPGSAPAVVVTEQAWERFFGRDVNVLGQTIRIGSSFDCTIVGVASNPLDGPAYAPDIWVTMAHLPGLVPGASDVLRSPAALWFGAVGRLRPGVTAEEADAILRLAGHRLKSTRKAGVRQEWRIHSDPVNRLRLGPDVYESRMRVLIILVAMSAGFLVVACGNVTASVITQITDRGHELAVRTALGATTTALIKPFALQILLLVSASGAATLLLLLWISSVESSMFISKDLSIGPTDGRTVAILVALSAVAASLMVAGTAIGIRKHPRRVSRVAEGSRVTGRSRSGQVLVASQAGLSVLFVISACLLFQSARTVARIPLGYVPNALVLQLFMPSGYTATDGIGLYRRLRDALSAHPGVAAVGLGWRAPLGDTNLNRTVIAQGSPTPVPTQTAANIVSPGYFEALEIRVIEGRGFGDVDDAGGPPVAIVSRSFADRAWPNQHAVGRELIDAKTQAHRRVIGVVEDVRYRTLIEPVEPLIYVPLAQEFMSWVYVHVRTTSDDPVGAASAIRREVAKLEPRLGVGEPRRLEDEVSRSLAAWRGPASLSAALAFLTLLLTMSGLSAAVASTASQRAKEMAIRVALGAEPRQVRTLVRREGMILAVSGIAVGLLVSAVALRYLESLLYGVTANDAATWLAATGLIIFVAWGSCSIPTRQVGDIDEIRLLKE